MHNLDITRDIIIYIRNYKNTRLKIETKGKNIDTIIGIFISIY